MNEQGLFITPNDVSVIRATSSDDNNFVMYKRETLVQFKDFVDNLHSTIKKNCILPKNCRYVENISRTRDLYVIEEPPAVRTLFFDSSDWIFKQEKNIIDNHRVRNKSDMLKFNLAFPYIIYVIDVSYNHAFCNVFYRVHPLKFKTDYLLKTNLPNVNSSDEVCMKERFNNFKSNEIPEQLIRVFWNSYFNIDYTENYLEYSKRIPQLRDFFTWHECTKKNPMFVLSLDWIKVNKTLDEHIMNIKRRYADSDAYFNFRESCSLADNKTKNYIYTSAIRCGKYWIAVGDVVEYENKKYNVYSIIDRNGTKKIELIDKNRKIIEVDLTNELRNSFVDYIYNKENNNVVINGIVINQGDVIKYKIRNYDKDLVMEIRNIRKSYDNVIELTDSFFNSVIADSIEKIEKIDLNNITIKGKKISKGDQIIILYSSSVNRLLKECVFEGASMENDMLMLKFLNKNQNLIDTYSIKSIENGSKIIIEQNEIIETKEISGNYRISCNLYSTNKEKIKVIKTNGGLFYERTFPYNYNTGTCLTNSGKSVFIDGVDYPINFNVGDNVVVFDWDHMSNIPKIQKIAGFEVKYSSLYFRLIGDDGINTREKFIHENIVYAGSIRHIHDRVGNIHSGMKVKAKYSKIYGFPKNHVNSVVGILVDVTGGNNHLILCSNCLTIPMCWTNLFDFISKTDPEYDKHELKYIIRQQVHNQPGDLFISSGYLYEYNNGKYYTLSYPFVVLNRKKPDMKRYGVLTPRIAPSILESHNRKEFIKTGHVTPDLCNGTMPDLFSVKKEYIDYSEVY